MSDYRVEHDLLGEKEVLKDEYHGIHTQRALENFTVSGQKIKPALISAFGIVKKSCAKSNYELGYLNKTKYDAIIAACDEMIGGKLDKYIVVDAMQGGAGTSTNMNINEVIANRALELLGEPKGTYTAIHPIEDVNMHQSTNDTYPTALKIATINLLQKLGKQIEGLQLSLEEKEKELASIIKIGRTQLQDAVPITLGAEFGAYAKAIARDKSRIEKCKESVKYVNLGGTAIGTGLGAPKAYIHSVVECLKLVSGLEISRAESLVDATQNMDTLCEVSSILKTHAVNLFKIASDLRLLSSGKSGLNEISLPSVQAGSSLMPGKVNPVICELINNIAMKVMANDTLVTNCAQNGQLELNAFAPLLANSLLESLELLINANETFKTKVILQITANNSVCEKHAHSSTGSVSALVEYIGYEKSSEVAKLIKEQHKTIKEALEAVGVTDSSILDIALSPEKTMPV